MTFFIYFLINLYNFARFGTGPVTSLLKKDLNPDPDLTYCREIIRFFNFLILLTNTILEGIKIP
jgi:hypothetical protein